MKFLLFALASLFAASALCSQDRVSVPEIAPWETRSYGPIEVTLTSSTSGASITYQIKRPGQETASFSYTGSFMISESATIEAVAKKQGMLDSFAATRDYTILQEVAPWGSIANAPVPENPSRVIAATTFITGMLALDIDGKALAYAEYSDYDQTPPDDPSNAIAIASGYDYSLALQADGTVRAWGSDSFGQLQVPAGLSNVVSLSAGYEAPLALKADGTVVAWGDRTGYQSLEPPADLTDLVAISSFEDVALGLRWDGTVVAWGNRNSRLARLPDGLSEIVAVHVARTHCMALKANGTVVAWGDWENQAGPALAEWKAITAISAGYDVSFGLKSDGSLEFWPKNENATLNPGTGLDGVVAIDVLHYSGVALRSSAKDTLPLVIDADASRGVVRKSIQKSSFKPGDRLQLTAFPKPGYGFAGWSGDVSSTQNPLNLAINSPTRVEARFLPVLSAPAIHVGDEALGGQPVSVTLEHGNPNGSIRYTLDGSQPGPQSPEFSQAVVIASPALLRAAVFAPGFAKSLEAAQRIEVARVVAPSALIGVDDPVIPAAAQAAIALSAGYHHSLALLPDGSVFSWDEYSFKTSDIPPAVALDAGWDTNIALHPDGSISAWNSARAIDVPETAQPAIAVAAGEAHFLSLTLDGQIHSWGGWNDDMTFVPAALKNVASIAAGGEHSIALLADGTVVEWNASERLSVPSGISDAIAIDAGKGYSVALTRAGNVHYWNEYGNMRSSPTRETSRRFRPGAATS